MKILLVYLLIINAAGCLLMLIDKRKAQKNRWRIPESTLLTVAALGGSFGCMLGMYNFRHKTRHYKFSIGLPVLFILHVAVMAWLVTVLP